VGNYFGESLDQASPLDVTRFDVRYRISGTTSNPNVYALWVTLLSGLGLAHLLARKRYLLLLALTAATSFVLLNTFSRGSLVTFALFLVLLLWQNFRLLDNLKTLYKVALVTALLVLLAASFLAEMVFLRDTIQLVMARTRDVTEVEDITHTGRALMILGGIELLKEPKTLLAGIGAGNFHPVCISKGLETGFNRWKDYSQSYSGIHNVYMKLLVEHGVFALIAFLMLFYVFASDVLRQSRASPGDGTDPWRAYTVALGISIALVASQVYESVTDYHVFLPIFVILAFMLSRKHIASNG
jgi:O-antigen ligase